MNLHFIFIVPIEFYTSERMQNMEHELVNNGVLILEKNEMAEVFSELTSGKGRFYRVTLDAGCELKFAVHESSACVYMLNVHKDWIADRQSVVDILRLRKQHHEEILISSNGNPVSNLISEITRLTKDRYSDIQWTLPKANYVFSFFIVEKPAGTLLPQEDILTMVEPSLVDADDMLSSDPNLTVDITKNIKKEYADKLIDVDIANTTETYISWATIVSAVEPKWFSKTKNLISALECRLQIVWNRCYSISEYIDGVFDQKIIPKDISKLYWNFVRSLDDAKSVLTATYSSRADALFTEMVKTSKITNEIDRMEKKITLLEKYIEQQNASRSRKYQKAIEILLFVTAIASLMQVLLPVPLSIFSVPVKYAIIILLFAVGAFAIIKNK